MPLDKYFRPINSPIAKDNGESTSAFDFGQNIARDSVTLSKIRNFSFNAGTGGTLTLGGTANGNGQFILKNSSGGTIVTGNNNGITVTNGSISIKNDANQIALDAKGIISDSNNFITTNTIDGSLNQIFSSTTFTDLIGSSITFSFERAATILILATCRMYLTESVGNTCDGTYTINIDGNDQFSQGQIHSGNDYLTTVTIYMVVGLSGGSHTIKLRAKLEAIYAGSPSMTIYAFTWSYIKLGT